MNIIKVCPICGATKIKQTGTEEHDNQLFSMYQCYGCDAKFSAYDAYIKKLKKEQAKQSTKPAPAEQPTATSVNPASTVYKKNIGCTVVVEGRIGAGVMCGTGTIISKNGYFITNAHVVTELSPDRKSVINLCDDVRGTGGGTRYRFGAEILFVDPSVDLALLKMDDVTELTPATFANSQVEPGEAVYAIGNSKGEGLCIVEGIVSDACRQVNGCNCIMISAPVTTGNSGGPVFNGNGELIGVVCSGHVGVSSMNYVIPIETIQSFLSKAEEKEGVNWN